MVPNWWVVTPKGAVEGLFYFHPAELETSVLRFQDYLRAFISKLLNWCRNFNPGNIAMFKKLCEVLDESEGEVDQFLKDEVTGHLEYLEMEFQ